MLEVKLYAAEGVEAKPMLKGSIVFDGRKLMTYPVVGSDKGLMDFVLAESIITPGNKIYDPVTEPELWLRNLYQAYRSYGLKASQAVSKE